MTIVCKKGVRLYTFSASYNDNKDKDAPEFELIIKNGDTVVDRKHMTSSNSSFKIVKGYSVTITRTTTKGNDEREYIVEPTGEKDITDYLAKGYTFGEINSDISIHIVYDGTCFVEGTHITMADGSYKKVEDVASGDEVMVFNHETGRIETSQVVFNEAEELNYYEIINCEFEKKTVRISYEHAFFDLTLNKYVYINDQTLNDYIGHEFVSIENGVRTSQKLVRTYKTTEFCRVYGLNSYKTLNFINDDMLSIEGNIAGLFNIFEYDPSTLKYDEAKKQKDIDKYGLFTLEDFGGQIDEFMFDAFNGQYLNVSIGKGMLTWERIEELIKRYAPLCK